MAAREDNAIGFVSWGETKTGYQSSCWMIGISLAPEARGHGYGTEATRQLARYLFLHTQMNRKPRPASQTLRRNAHLRRQGLPEKEPARVPASGRDSGMMMCSTACSATR
jgi:GNAT superfamily N-acetyltransferase